jgi:hypothetical protein
MEISEKKISNYIFERQLHRTLNAEYVKLSALLVKQVKLLKERMALMADMSEAEEQRWADEEKEAERCIHSATATEEKITDK